MEFFLTYVRYDDARVSWSWQGTLVLIGLNLFFIILAFQYQIISQEASKEKEEKVAAEVEQQKKISCLYPKEPKNS